MLWSSRSKGVSPVDNELGGAPVAFVKDLEDGLDTASICY